MVVEHVKYGRGKIMSLDVSLHDNRSEVYTANITHNLALMAEACGVYYACWRPDEIHCKKAKHILPMLKTAIIVLKAHPDFYKKFNPSNGWGSYEGLIDFLIQYSEACEKYPEAKIEISR